MPCNSDYMEPSAKEIGQSRVACVLDELAGKETQESWWDGYHPAIYGCHLSKPAVDRMVRYACEQLSGIDTAKLSLETQIWWRDHQRADAERKQREKDMAEKQALVKQALAKLSAEERKVLGL